MNTELLPMFSYHKKVVINILLYIISLRKYLFPYKKLSEMVPFNQKSCLFLKSLKYADMSSKRYTPVYIPTLYFFLYILYITTVYRAYIWPYHSVALGQTTGREHSPIHQQKIGLKTYWAWPCPSEQDLFAPEPVTLIRELPQAFYPYPPEGR